MVPATTRIPDCVPEGEGALALARASEWRFGEAYSQSFLAFCYGAYGDYARAMAMASRLWTIGEEIGHRAVQLMAHGALGVYLSRSPRRTGRAAASRARPRTRAGTRRGPLREHVAGYLATAYLASGDSERAAALLADGICRPIFRAGHSASGVSGSRARNSRAPKAIRPARSTIVEEMIATAPNIAQAPGGAIPRLDLLRGEALAALGRDEEAASYS